MAVLGAGIEIRYDYRGIGEIMRSAWLQGVMAEAANAVAAQLTDDFDEVFVDTYTTDRGAAAVTVFNRGGNAEGSELVSGKLTEAAISVGLEVSSR